MTLSIYLGTHHAMDEGYLSKRSTTKQSQRDEHVEHCKKKKMYKRVQNDPFFLFW